MRNPYNTLIKVLDKSNMLLVVRFDGYYYLTNGFFVKAIKEAEYNAYFRTAKPYYLEMNDGQEFTRRSDGLPQIQDSLPDRKDQFKKMWDGRDYPVIKTSLVDTVLGKQPRKKSPDARILISNNSIIAINEDYWQACGPDDLYESKGTSISPVISNSAVILPIRQPNAFTEGLRCLADALNA